MAEFHDVLFPAAVSFGATGGPERRVEIVQMTSGREQRNARLRHSRRHYDAGTGVRSLSDLYEIMDFFEARRGSLHGFRFRDPFDMKSCRPDATIAARDQRIGTGDGVARVFQLAKTYGVGEDAYVRPIRKVLTSSVRVAVAGAELAPNRFAVDAATGLVTLMQAPVEGAAVTAGFEFHVPVRFDTERIAISLTAFKAGQIPSIPLIEVSA
ncbi:TIGR02217 family protein [Tianweitania populi]|uniref:Glycoside hydrolase family 24 n=1 Tax=Tianweitania populi TaxID=1607949 RepID=A0A8J3DRS8_9HYPH|nr:DUF2460 domain-containing protein [Tianweitania populi]GHD06529.1 glycoside hydrolase family 24 [Tianweitania populi]